MAKIIARVLSQFGDSDNLIKPNDIVEGESSVIKSLEKAGLVDSAKEAVAYAKTAGGKKYDVRGDGVDLSELGSGKAEIAKLEKKIEALNAELAKATDEAVKVKLAEKLTEATASLEALNK